MIFVMSVFLLLMMCAGSSIFKFRSSSTNCGILKKVIHINIRNNFYINLLYKKALLFDFQQKREKTGENGRNDLVMVYILQS